MYVSGDTYACATEESNACPLIPYLIYSFCLLISCQKHFAKAEKWNDIFENTSIYTIIISYYLVVNSTHYYKSNKYQNIIAQMSCIG